MEEDGGVFEGELMGYVKADEGWCTVGVRLEGGKGERIREK